MIYATDGSVLYPHNTDGTWSANTFDSNGNALELNQIFDDEFAVFDTATWSCKSGAYMDWQYLPVDYSENAYTNDGKLIIRNLKNHPVEQYDWSGAYMETKGKYSFQYGIIMARIKFPSDADRYHATFWMVGNTHGEIDIAEADSGKVTAAVHWFDRDGQNYHVKTIGEYNVDASEYHTYMCQWDENYIQMSCDGFLLGSFAVENATIDGFNSFRQPFYLILNTNPYSTQYKEYAASNSVTNLVDWIRIYSN